MLWLTTVIKSTKVKCQTQRRKEKKRKPRTYLVKILPFSPTASPTALLLLSNLGSSMATNISQQSLVWSQTFTGTCRFLTGCLPFLSSTSSLFVNQLWANGKNWFGTITMQNNKNKFEVRVFCIVFCDILLSCKMWLVSHANEWQETSNSTNTAGN